MYQQTKSCETSTSIQDVFQWKVIDEWKCCGFLTKKTWVLMCREVKVRSRSFNSAFSFSTLITDQIIIICCVLNVCVLNLFHIWFWHKQRPLLMCESLNNYLAVKADCKYPVWYKWCLFFSFITVVWFHGTIGYLWINAFLSSSVLSVFRSPLRWRSPWRLAAITSSRVTENSISHRLLSPARMCEMLIWLRPLEASSIIFKISEVRGRNCRKVLIWFISHP